MLSNMVRLTMSLALLTTMIGAAARDEDAPVVRGATAAWHLEEPNCAYCNDWATTPTSPYTAHQFGAGGEANEEDATRSSVYRFASALPNQLVTIGARATSRPAIRNGQWYMDCDAFNSCHSNIQDGGCQNWHWACRFGEDLIVELESALHEREARSIAEVIDRAGGLIIFAGERAALQLHDCNGRLLAQYSLPKSLVLGPGRG